MQRVATEFIAIKNLTTVAIGANRKLHQFITVIYDIGNFRSRLNLSFNVLIIEGL